MRQTFNSEPEATSRKAPNLKLQLRNTKFVFLHAASKNLGIGVWAMLLVWLFALGSQTLQNHNNKSRDKASTPQLSLRSHTSWFCGSHKETSRAQHAYSYMRGGWLQLCCFEALRHPARAPLIAHAQFCG
jgi:hypothetical protein